MLRTSFCLYTIFSILCFTFLVSAENYNALIFDRFKKSLIELPEEIPEDAKCGKWATACPAKSTAEGRQEINKKKPGELEFNRVRRDEQEFNQNKSFYKNALFVQNLYDGDGENQKDMKVKICGNPFKLSIVMFDENPLHYEYGFEIYNDRFSLKKIAFCDKTKYRSLQNTLTKSGSPEYLETRSSIKPATKADQEKDFMWLPLFRVRFMSGHLSRIEYEIRRNNREPMLQCKDFSLGKELYSDVDVDGFYSEKSQTYALQGINLPEKAGCDSATTCFEKWLLIPADQFQFGSSSLPICSNITTVPIWSNLVKPLLKKLDRYLYTLSRITGAPLRIVAGVHNVLQFKTKMNQQKHIILKTGKLNLRVSEIIYKLVKFREYGVFIVIHNDPTFTGKVKICEDKTEQLGWDDIVYKNLSIEKYDNNDAESTDANNIYVCPITKDILQLAGMDHDKDLPIAELSLKRFPYYKNETELKYKNVKHRILKELIEEIKPKFESSSVIERPFFYDNDFTLEPSGILDELSSEELEDDKSNEKPVNNEKIIVEKLNGDYGNEIVEAGAESEAVDDEKTIAKKLVHNDDGDEALLEGRESKNAVVDERTTVQKLRDDFEQKLKNGQTDKAKDDEETIDMNQSEKEVK